MKTYFISPHLVTQTKTSKSLRKKKFPVLFLLFSALSLLIINSCSTDFNAAQTNKHSNAATLAETRDAPCGPTGTPPDGCTDTTFYDVPIAVGACTVFVDYTVRKCQNSFSIFNLHYDYDTTNVYCNALQTYILNKFNQGEFHAATTALNQIYSFVATKIEEIELGKFTIPNCNSGYNINSQIFAASCLQLCLDEENENNPRVVQIFCGEGCCSRYSYYCYDENLKKVLMSHQNGPIPSCENNDACNSELHSDCTVNCDRVLYNPIISEF